jgi:hypothetical protein
MDGENWQLKCLNWFAFFEFSISTVRFIHLWQIVRKKWAWVKLKRELCYSIWLQVRGWELKSKTTNGKQHSLFTIFKYSTLAHYNFFSASKKVQLKNLLFIVAYSCFLISSIRYDITYVLYINWTMFRPSGVSLWLFYYGFFL